MRNNNINEGYNTIVPLRRIYTNKVSHPKSPNSHISRLHNHRDIIKLQDTNTKSKLVSKLKVHIANWCSNKVKCYSSPNDTFSLNDTIATS